MCVDGKGVVGVLVLVFVLAVVGEVGGCAVRVKLVTGCESATEGVK